jgi:hypothetical protein
MKTLRITNGRIIDPANQRDEKAGIAPLVFSAAMRNPLLPRERTETSDCLK